MPPRKLPKTLSPEEVRALMAMPNLAAPTGLRDRCVLELMYRAGLRVSEVCGLHLRDVKWSEAKLHLRQEVAKGGREAYVSLEPQTLALLERWKEVRRRYAPRQPWLFTTLRSTPITRRDMWKMVDRRSRKAGIKHVHPHMLRHTFATELLREGFNLREVQTALRHADIRTTVIYTHVHDQELHEKIRSRR